MVSAERVRTKLRGGGAVIRWLGSGANVTLGACGQVEDGRCCHGSSQRLDCCGR